MEALRVFIKTLGIILIIFLSLKILLMLYFQGSMNNSNNSGMSTINISKKLRTRLLKFYSNLYNRYLHDQYININNKDKSKVSFSILGTLRIDKIESFKKESLITYSTVYKFPILFLRDIEHSCLTLTILAENIDVKDQDDLSPYLKDDSKYMFQYIYNFDSNDILLIGKHFLGRINSKRRLIKDIYQFVDIIDNSSTILTYDDILYFDPDDVDEETSNNMEDNNG